MERLGVGDVGAVEGYHFAAGRLVLGLPGGREALLECRCGRGHWLVVERGAPAGGELAVTCHGCGTRATIALARRSPGPPSASPGFER